MLTFNSFILGGLLLRILFVLIGIVLSLKIIGFKNLKFLKQYVKTSFFSLDKLFYWLVAFLSIIYFEHLVSSSKSVTFSEVYEKNWFLSLIVIFLLFGVVLYAIIDTYKSIKDAKEHYKELSKAQTVKQIADVVSVASFFVPGGWFVKGALFGASSFANHHIDKKVKSKLSKAIIANIEVMVLIALVNLSIVLIATYLITNQILFW